MKKLILSLTLAACSFAAYAQDEETPAEVVTPPTEVTETAPPTTETAPAAEPPKAQEPVKPAVPKVKPINTQMYGKKLAEYVSAKLQIKEKDQARVGAACTAMMNKFKPLKKYSNANDLDLIMEKVEPIVLAFERQMEADLSKKKKEVLKKIGLEIRETVAQQVRASGNNFNPDVVIKSLGTAFQEASN
jgi:hypothetical protein